MLTSIMDGPKVKFIYSEKVSKFCEFSTNYLSYVLPVKQLVEILQKFVAFSEYMNFKKVNCFLPQMMLRILRVLILKIRCGD